MVHSILQKCLIFSWCQLLCIYCKVGIYHNGRTLCRVYHLLPAPNLSNIVCSTAVFTWAVESNFNLILFHFTTLSDYHPSPPPPKKKKKEKRKKTPGIWSSNQKFTRRSGYPVLHAIYLNLHRASFDCISGLSSYFLIGYPELEPFSFQCRKVIGFASTMLRGWLKKLALYFFIQSEVKPKPAVTRSHTFFRALRQLHVTTSATCNYEFKFWLVHCFVCVFFDWLEWLLWFCFYVTQLKTALLHVLSGYSFTTLNYIPLYWSHELKRKKITSISQGLHLNCSSSLLPLSLSLSLLLMLLLLLLLWRL